MEFLEIWSSLQKAEGNDRLRIYDKISKFLAEKPQKHLPDSYDFGVLDISQLEEDIKIQNPEKQMSALNAVGYLLASNYRRSFAPTQRKNLIFAIIAVIKMKKLQVCCKAFWCLNRIDLSDMDQEMMTELIESLDVIFLSDKSIVFARETCLFLNRLVTEHLADMEGEITAVLKYIILPVFHSDQKVREVAFSTFTMILPSLMKFQSEVSPIIAKLLNKKDMTDLFNKNEEKYVLTIWCHFVKILGKELHTGTFITNELTEVIEKGFKSSSEEVLIESYKAWLAIIDNFSLDPRVINNPKRLRLLLRPLKLNNMKKYENVFPTVCSTFWHLVINLKSGLSSSFEQAFLPLLEFTVSSALQEGSESHLSPRIPQPSETKSIYLRKTACEMVIRILDGGKSPEPLDASQGTLKISVDPLSVPVQYPVLMRHFKALVKASKIIVTDLGKIEEMEPMLDKLLQLLISQISVDSQKCNKELVDAVPALLSLLADTVKEELCSARLCLKTLDRMSKLPQRLLTSHHYHLGRFSTAIHDNLSVSLMTLLLMPYIFSVGKTDHLYLDAFKRFAAASISGTASPLLIGQKFLAKMEAKYIDCVSDKLHMWSSVASSLLDAVKKTQEVNQGDSLENDFSCMYAALIYPVVHFMPPKVSPLVFKSSLKLWIQLYKLFIRFASLIPSVEENSVCECFCQKLKAAVQEDYLMEEDYFETLCLMMQAVLESINFKVMEVRTRKSDGALMKSLFMKNKGKPMGNLTSTIGLLSVLLNALHMKYSTEGNEEPDSKEPVRLKAARFAKFSLSLDLTKIVVTNITTSILIPQVLKTLAEPISKLMLMSSEKKPSGMQLVSKMESLWTGLTTTIIEHYKGTYDTELLNVMNHVLVSALTHSRRSIQEKARQFWSKTFGCQNSSLKYPATLREALVRSKLILDTMNPPEVIDEIALTGSLTETANDLEVVKPHLRSTFATVNVGSPVTRSENAVVNASTSLKKKRTLSKPDINDLPDEEFVRIKPEENNLPVTPSRKLRMRKSFVPAMYNDLSQNSGLGSTSLLSESSYSCGLSQLSQDKSKQGVKDEVLACNSTSHGQDNESKSGHECKDGQKNDEVKSRSLYLKEKEERNVKEDEKIIPESESESFGVSDVISKCETHIIHSQEKPEISISSHNSDSIENSKDGLLVSSFVNEAQQISLGQSVFQKISTPVKMEISDSDEIIPSSQNSDDCFRSPSRRMSRLSRSFSKQFGRLPSVEQGESASPVKAHLEMLSIKVETDNSVCAFPSEKSRNMNSAPSETSSKELNSTEATSVNSVEIIKEETCNDRSNDEFKSSHESKNADEKVVDRCLLFECDSQGSDSKQDVSDIAEIINKLFGGPGTESDSVTDSVPANVKEELKNPDRLPEQIEESACLSTEEFVSQRVLHSDSNDVKSQLAAWKKLENQAIGFREQDINDNQEKDIQHSITETVSFESNPDFIESSDLLPSRRRSKRVIAKKKDDELKPRLSRKSLPVSKKKISSSSSQNKSLCVASSNDAEFSGSLVEILTPVAAKNERNVLTNSDIDSDGNINNCCLESDDGKGKNEKITAGTASEIENVRREINVEAKQKEIPLAKHDYAPLDSLAPEEVSPKISNYSVCEEPKNVKAKQQDLCLNDKLEQPSAVGSQEKNDVANLKTRRVLSESLNISEEKNIHTVQLGGNLEKNNRQVFKQNIKRRRTTSSLEPSLQKQNIATRNLKRKSSSQTQDSVSMIAVEENEPAGVISNKINVGNNIDNGIWSSTENGKIVEPSKCKPLHSGKDNLHDYCKTSYLTGSQTTNISHSAGVIHPEIEHSGITSHCSSSSDIQEAKCHVDSTNIIVPIKDNKETDSSHQQPAINQQSVKETEACTVNWLESGKGNTGCSENDECTVPESCSVNQEEAAAEEMDFLHDISTVEMIVESVDGFKPVVVNNSDMNDISSPGYISESNDTQLLKEQECCDKMVSQVQEKLGVHVSAGVKCLTYKDDECQLKSDEKFFSESKFPVQMDNKMEQAKDYGADTRQNVSHLEETSNGHSGEEHGSNSEKQISNACSETLFTDEKEICTDGQASVRDTMGNVKLASPLMSGTEWRHKLDSSQNIITDTANHHLESDNIIGIYSSPNSPVESSVPITVREIIAVGSQTTDGEASVCDDSRVVYEISVCEVDVVDNKTEVVGVEETGCEKIGLEAFEPESGNIEGSNKRNVVLSENLNRISEKPSSAGQCENGGKSARNDKKEASTEKDGAFVTLSDPFPQLEEKGDSNVASANDSESPKSPENGINDIRHIQRRQLKITDFSPRLKRKRRSCSLLQSFNETTVTANSDKEISVKRMSLPPDITKNCGESKCIMARSSSECEQHDSIALNMYKQVCNIENSSQENIDMEAKGSVPLFKDVGMSMEGVLENVEKGEIESLNVQHAISHIDTNAHVEEENVNSSSVKEPSLLCEEKSDFKEDGKNELNAFQDGKNQVDKGTDEDEVDDDLTQDGLSPPTEKVIDSQRKLGNGIATVGEKIIAVDDEKNSASGVLIETHEQGENANTEASSVLPLCSSCVAAEEVPDSNSESRIVSPSSRDLPSESKRGAKRRKNVTPIRSPIINRLRVRKLKEAEKTIAKQHKKLCRNKKTDVSDITDLLVSSVESLCKKTKELVVEGTLKNFSDCSNTENSSVTGMVGIKQNVLPSVNKDGADSKESKSASPDAVNKSSPVLPKTSLSPFSRSHRILQAAQRQNLLNSNDPKMSSPSSVFESVHANSPSSSRTSPADAKEGCNSPRASPGICIRGKKLSYPDAGILKRHSSVESALFNPKTKRVRFADPLVQERSIEANKSKSSFHLVPSKKKRHLRLHISQRMKEQVQDNEDFHTTSCPLTSCPRILGTSTNLCDVLADVMTASQIETLKPLLDDLKVTEVKDLCRIDSSELEVLAAHSLTCETLVKAINYHFLETQSSVINQVIFHEESESVETNGQSIEKFQSVICCSSDKCAPCFSRQRTVDNSSSTVSAHVPAEQNLNENVEISHDLCGVVAARSQDIEPEITFENSTVCNEIPIACDAVGIHITENGANNFHETSKNLSDKAFCSAMAKTKSKGDSNDELHAAVQRIVSADSRSLAHIPVNLLARCISKLSQAIELKSEN